MTQKTYSRKYQRDNLFEEIFSRGVPRLWCPPLTHYKDDGSIDDKRIEAHWKRLSPHVTGFLVPGSTGDGWELKEHEVNQLIDLAVSMATQLDVYLLIGVLKSDMQSVRRTISQIMAHLQERVGCEKHEDTLVQAKVCGFSVCPPWGEELTQQSIEAALASVLELGFPIALYQLPQITQNEVAPDTFARLAKRFKNLAAFKDSSGADHVALNDSGDSGVFLMRGAEGEYIQWLGETGGPYNGLLLSTANCFSADIAEMIRAMEEGRVARATEISENLTVTVQEVFDQASGLPVGNAFANSNKGIDHFMAHGAEAENVAPPMLHAGVRLPLEFIRATGKILRRQGLMPTHGYLD